MTIQTQASKAQFPGNGGQTLFTCPFLLPAANELEVITTAPDGTQTTISPGPAAGQYQLTGVGVATGFSVTYQQSTGPLPSGWLITMARELPLIQTTSLQVQNSLFQTVIENALDYLTMLVQQFVELVGRTPRLPIGAVSTFDRDLPTPVANMGIGINSTADGFALIATPGSITIPVPINQGGTGATTAPQALANLGASPGPWTVGPTPTFVDPVTFTLTGDQSAIFEVGRALQLSITGNTVYAFATAVDYNISSPGLTTVRIIDASAALDNTLSAVNYSTIDATHPEIPVLPASVFRVSDPSDPTKRVDLDVSQVPTGTTVTMTVLPNGTIGIPSGAMLDFAGTAAPTGWRLCDGSTFSRTGATLTLYQAIGTTWGVGDGTTTANLPDFRRRVAVGSGGAGTAVLANTVGSVGGEETHLQTLAELVAHTHAMRAASNNYANGASGATNNLTLTDQTGSTGGGTPFNVMQPSAVVTKIIKI